MRSIKTYRSNKHYSVNSSFIFSVPPRNLIWSGRSFLCKNIYQVHQREKEATTAGGWWLTSARCSVDADTELIVSANQPWDAAVRLSAGKTGSLKKNSDFHWSKTRKVSFLESNVYLYVQKKSRKSENTWDFLPVRNNTHVDYLQLCILSIFLLLFISSSFLSSVFQSVGRLQPRPPSAPWQEPPLASWSKVNRLPHILHLTSPPFKKLHILSSRWTCGGHN